MCSHLPSEKSFHVRLKREREKRKEGREGGKNVIDSVYKTRSDILQGASGEERGRERGEDGVDGLHGRAQLVHDTTKKLFDM